MASGGVKYLSQFTDVTSLLGAFPGTDPVAVNQNKPWLFNGDILVNIKGSSAVAIVLSDFGGWSAPVPFSTMRFRRLRVDIYVDALRDSGGNITETSGDTGARGTTAFNALHFRLQRTDSDVVFWGDLSTLACQLLTEPQFVRLPDGDWGQLGTAYYGLTLAGWSDASELCGGPMGPCPARPLPVCAVARR